MDEKTLAEIRKLPPKDRLKRLEELEKERLKAAEEAKKIVNESINEIKLDEMLQELEEEKKNQERKQERMEQMLEESSILEKRKEIDLSASDHSSYKLGSGVHEDYQSEYTPIRNQNSSDQEENYKSPSTDYKTSSESVASNLLNSERIKNKK